MEFNSKFKIDQYVWAVTYSRLETHEKCPACNGVGWVVLNDGKDYQCPKCYGEGYLHDYLDQEYRISLKSQVGKITIEQTGDEYNETYMLKATGVPSGQVWSADQLFASQKEAQEYCDKMNKKAEKND
jgi:hypothetical protein